MKKQIYRVCIVDTVYSLLIYLLYTNENDLDNTFYFFGDGIPKSIRERFVNHYYFDNKCFLNQNLFWLFLTLRIGSYFRWPFLRKALIIGHDHLPYSPFLIGNRMYTYIEDAPYIFSIHAKGHLAHSFTQYWSSKRWIKKMINKVIGDTYFRPVANNRLCKEVIQTMDDYVPYLEKKIITKVSLSCLWNKSSLSKQRKILNYYDILDEDVKKIRSKSVILFTQQFATDNIITEKEQIEIYSNIINGYNFSDLLIKPHPRDTIDYSRYYPGVEVFTKVAPVQIFELLDVKFIKAVTINSSSVLSFSYDLEIIWIGTGIHPKVYKYYGDQKLTDFGKKNMKSLK